MEKKEISGRFLDLVNPYFHSIGLRTISSFTYYGESRETLVYMPEYFLFKDGKPFNSSIKLGFYFLTQDTNLFCKSFFSYCHSNGCYDNHEPEPKVVYDLFKKRIEQKKQDGINFPILSGTYFASTDSALFLMYAIKDTIEKIDSKSMKELNILHNEYVSQVRQGEHSDTTIQQKMFKEAYENKLEEIIIDCNLSAQASAIINN